MNTKKKYHSSDEIRAIGKALPELVRRFNEKRRDLPVPNKTTKSRCENPFLINALTLEKSKFYNVEFLHSYEITRARQDLPWIVMYYDNQVRRYNLNHYIRN